MLMSSHDDIVARGLPDGPENAPAVLSFRNITKAFGPTVAVNDVSFDLRPGEIHALVGENGAGKSTLIRVLAGDHQPDAGSIVLNGQPVRFERPDEALRHGIGFVHQVPMYVADLSITENLSLGIPFRRNAFGLIDWAAEHKAAKRDLEMVGVHADPRDPVARLGPAERQLVSVARSLRRGLSVLVLDEVTASLTEPEVWAVHDRIKHLGAQGIAILYVSHRLDEIFRVADRVTVMRDGRRITTLPVAEVSRRELVKYIVGSEVGDLFSRSSGSSLHDAGPPRLELKGVGDDKLKELDLELFPGEIVGIAGLSGSGRSRLLKMIYGESPYSEGEIRLDGSVCRFRSASDALTAGIGLITEDRIADGFVDTLPIWKNVTLPWTPRLSSYGFLNLRQERTLALEGAERVAVKMPGIDALMTQLSGGNQQKAIFARWISAPIKLLLLDEPTHGVDVRSKAQIYALIRDLTKRGVSIMLASSEVEELVGLSDRVIVLNRNRIKAELAGDDINKDRILHSLLDEHEPTP